ncbi:Planctomycete cytochrome C [Posidoniimonas polymericola]|uniref:Planctomycete cytochrome C n=1 Tax=Posidoniimonas polymericola TaxID=2528002 RepID=A0A5C5YTS1_9BACT|nr:PSD1 and planctomycete cytochrome C domain-containing protein [Posidoniimonas polymericola]TWT78067.1 Planctomycete cytochrome C [Posidoniimonas polymericola]
MTIRLLVAALLAWMLSGGPVLLAASPADLEFFESKVRPLLAEHCYECHSAAAGDASAGLRLDHRQTILAGGDTGPAVAIDDPQASLLLEAVRFETLQMPPSGKLPAADIATLERWVSLGAPWPDEPVPTAEGAAEVFDLEQRRDNHWAWRPVQHPAPPEVRDQAWPSDPLDRFVLAGLEESGLRPAAPKSRSALLRRLYFDLIGLPPSPTEIQAYLADESPQATERVVEALLASRHFGERWARHWLDLVRYAESRGHEYEYDAPNAYQYRDYVIRALNADVPYDQFLTEHLAGDLIDPPRLHPTHGQNESVLGTGFWHLGEWVHSPVDTRKDETDRFDNMVDVMSKSMLAMTVSCARCHDHKFDAISSADYYALCGFLQSSDFRQTRFESMEHNRGVAARLARLDELHRRRLRTLIGDALLAADQALPAAASAERSPTPPCPVTARTLVDFAALPAGEFRQDGYGFGPSVRDAAELYLAGAGESTLCAAGHASAAFDPFWLDLENVSQPYVNSPGKLDPSVWGGRTLRTPTVKLQSGEVYVLVRGGGNVFACVDTHRTLAGPLHQETLVAFGQPEGSDTPHWVAMRLGRYAGSSVHFEFCPVDDGALEVLRVVERGASDAAGDETQLAGQEAEALRRWRDNEPLPAAVAQQLSARLNAVLADPAAHLPSGVVEQMTSLVAEWSLSRRGLESDVQRRSHLAMTSMDLSGEDDHRLIRGGSGSPAEVVPRRFLAAIDGGRPLKVPSGSGRLELARRVTAPDNPLTTRVIVNRLWQHLLGDGIVPTPDNFGVLGQVPTHPELLDYLASEFSADGQSLKRMIRRIVLSSTYAMSCDQSLGAAERDPQNRLWSYVPLKRLEAEAIRDALLALAGNLSPQMGGPSVPLHLTSFMQGRGRPKQSGPLDGDRRRSIYLEVRRNFLSPMALAFDFPAPFSSMGLRTRSNVPAQALMLLNSPFVQQQSAAWAQTAVAQSEGVDGRIEYLYQSGLCRAPTENERARLAEFVTQEAADRGASTDDPAVWADAAHALVNAKEFLYLP